MISEFDSLLLGKPMESGEEQSTVQGMYPEKGAIFMSSSSTKNECFRQRLFGLPSGQWPFVKQVKAGMVLFLFEHEKRELHGVFQASSDGMMNIVPNAWSRSGNKFPAQVRVEPIWRCHPLPESEFGDAIKENYFSKWKFNFGLSKAQVRRLLILFSSRRMGSPYPQRALVRNTAGKLVGFKHIDVELDDERLTIEAHNLRNVGNKLQSINQDFSKVDVHRSLTPESCSEFGINGRDEPYSFPFNPSNYPSFVVDRGHPVATQNIPVHELGPFTANVTSSEEVQCRSECHTRPDDLESVHHHECKCSDHKISDKMLWSDFLEDKDSVFSRPRFSTPGWCPENERKCSHPESSDKMLSSDLLEKTGSVFSRLRVNIPGWCLENLGHLGHKENVKDTSPIDGVIAMSSENHYPWMVSEKFELRKRRQGNAEKSLNTKQTSVKSELKKIPEKSNTDFSPIGDIDDQNSKEQLFLDFKRRSEMQKVKSDANVESVGSEGLLGGQCKRRKLIRPNFSENRSSSMNSPGAAHGRGSPEDACGKKRKLDKPNFRQKESSQESSGQCYIGADAGGKRRKLARPNFNTSALISSPQCSVSEDAGGSCESFVGSQSKLLSQGAESSHDNKKIDTECFSKYEKEIMVDSSGVSSKIGDDNGKECLHAYPGISCQNLQASVDDFSCENANYKRKLDGQADITENELRVPLHECSSGQYANEKYEAMVGNQGSLDAQVFPTSEMEIKMESYEGSIKIGDESRKYGNIDTQRKLKIGDESGKDTVHDVRSQIAIVPSKDDDLHAQEVSEHKDPGLLSRDDLELSQSSMLESSLRLETNDGTRNGFSEIESGRGSEPEVLPGVELSRNMVGQGESRKQDPESSRVAENFSNVDLGMINCQHGSSTEQAQASCKFNHHDLLKQQGVDNDMLKAGEVGDNASHTSREIVTDIKLQCHVNSVKSGDQHGMESVQVNTVIPEDTMAARLFEEFSETVQTRVQETVMPPNMNSTTNIGSSEIEADRCSDVLEAVEVGANASHTSRETGTDIKVQSFVDSAKSRGEPGPKNVQVINSALEDTVHARLSDFTETNQISVQESVMLPNMNSGMNVGSSEIEADRSSDLEVLLVVENAPNCADASMVNNVQEVHSEQLQTSVDSINHISPHEHGSENKVRETMDVGSNKAIDDSVRENQRLWSILTSRLQLLRKAQRQ